MFIVLSLFLPFFLGLGLLVTPLDSYKEDGHRLPDRRPLLWAIGFLLGVLINYAVLLIVRNLLFCLVISATLSCLGFILFGVKHKAAAGKLFRIRWPSIVILAYFTMLYAVPILFDPLHGWDARSIWFFHGKLIYFNGGINAAALDKSFEFSHLDYPKLIAALSAQVAYVAGFWNEYIPKASLLALLIPGLLALLSFGGGYRLSFLFLLVMFPFSLDSALWDGYMDGYMALYGITALLLFGRWLKEKHPFDIIGGTLFMGVVLNLKNEGSLFVLCFIFTLLSCLCFKRRTFFLQMRQYLPRGGWIPLSLSAGCFLLWLSLKVGWGLENDLDLGAGSLVRMYERWNLGTFQLMIKALLIQTPAIKALFLVIISLSVLKAFSGRWTQSLTLISVTTLLYFSGIFVVYLSTPKDLMWHLSTSVPRTMLPVVLGLFAIVYTAIQEIEDQKAVSPGERCGEH